MIRKRRSFDPHSIKLVIFDLDGTLIDSRLDLVHSVNAALRHIGRTELPDDVIASYVGDGAPVLIQRALGGETVDEALIRKGLEFFLSYYRRAQTRSHHRLRGDRGGSDRDSERLERFATKVGRALEQAGYPFAGDR